MKKKQGKHLRTGSLCNSPDLDHPSVLSCLLSVVLSAAGGFRGVTGEDVPIRSSPATATGPSPFPCSSCRNYPGGQWCSMKLCVAG